MKRRDFNSLMLGSLATAAAGRMKLPIELQATPRVNGDRLNAHIVALSEFGRNPMGGVTRVAYSDADVKARTAVMEWMRAASIDPSVDAAGNIIARRAGKDSSLKPLLFGSHVDSVPEGGNFDGPVGTLGAIEVAQTLAEQHIVTRHPLEVVVWQNEEGGLVGSRAVSGQLAAAELSSVSNSGKTLREGMILLGGNPDQLDQVRRKKGDIAGYFELHIEQGGTLEAAKLDIGVVEGIVGIKQWEVTITGFANHAGTTPMNQRHDALLAGARFVEAVNRIVRAMPGRQVGTVGRMQVFPGAPNVIPGKVVCTLELRDLDDRKIDVLYEKIHTAVKQISGSEGVTFDFKSLHENVAAPSDPRMRSIVAAAAKELGLTTRVMPSGAGHDAQAMAQLGPMGMIFIPSVGGISHSPKELSRPQDITNGANVLLRSVLAADAALA